MFAKSITAALLGTTLLATAAFAQTATTTTTDRANMAPAASASTAQGQWRSSKLVGLNVYNDKNESLGDINELLTDAKGNITQVVLGVGGFLGVGERFVAVPFEKIKWVNEPVSSGSAAMNSRPVGPAATPSTGAASTTTTTTTTGAATSTTASSGNRWYPDHAVYNATKDELKAMPEFKYNN
jgi:sporulation protein YlmC with PRC-barrel domain